MQQQKPKKDKKKKDNNYTAIKGWFCIKTGTQRSCMSFKAFKRIYGTTNAKKIDAKLDIRDAGGNDFGSQGTYLLPMQLMVKRIVHDIVVLENLQDNIIGID